MAAEYPRDVTEALLTLERSKVASERAHAAQSLYEHVNARRDRSGFSEWVARLISDRQPDVRRAGLALAAVTLPHEEAADLMVRHLRDPSVDLRVEAAGRLADFALPERRGALAAALEDSAFAVRFEAARGMAALQHPAGYDLLIEALEKDEYRFRALGALVDLGDQRALPAVRALFRKWFVPGFERVQAAGVLARWGDAEGAKYLLRVTEKGWSPERAMAIELCGEVKAPGALDRLLAIVADRKDPCRGAAARGLGRLGDPKGSWALYALLEEAASPEDLRLDAAEGLCLIDFREARPRVEKALETLPPEARDELRRMIEDFQAGAPP